MRKKGLNLSFFILFVCCLIGLLSACGQQSVVATNQSSSANSTQSVTHTNQPVAQMGQNSSPQSDTQPVVQTVPMPPTQTSCPADGTARAAVMKPLALGKNQNLVYIYNEIPVNTSTAYGHLKRYDLNTQQKTDIVTSGISIESAQISADGQRYSLIFPMMEATFRSTRLLSIPGLICRVMVSHMPFCIASWITQDSLMISLYMANFLSSYSWSALSLNTSPANILAHSNNPGCSVTIVYSHK